MKLKKVSLNDFKCFKDIEVEFARITILTGANSSGKSSLLQSILAPLQSSDFPFSLSINGKFVNLGDFADIAYMHDEKKIIHLDYLVANDSNDINIKTAWKINAPNRLPRLVSLSAQTVYYNLEIKAVEEKYYLTFKYYSDKDPEKESGYNSYRFAQRINQFLDDILTKNEKLKEREMETFSNKLEEKFKRNEEPIEIISNSIDDLKRQAGEKGSFVLDQALTGIIKIFSNFESNFNFISSFRFNPQKLRFEISKADLKVGRHGENYEDQIVQWELKQSKEFEELASIMKELELFEGIQVKRIEGGNYQLLLKVHENGAFSSITDVGFGISQFLPIIISDIQLGDSSTLAMSQPEIHLHPASVQSEFGNYINTKVNKTKKNYIIETHSEYLLNKLRLLVVKGDLKKDDLRVHYISNKGNTVEHHKIEFTEDGQILNAPEEFFETYMTDVMDIALNA